MNMDAQPKEQTESDAAPLPKDAREAISKKLETLWERYIDAIHRFIALNISVIVGLAAFVSYLPRLRGTGETSTPLEHKRLLFSALVFLMFSLICEVGLRVWAQMFMEYEILQPREDMDKYFKGLVPYTRSYRLEPKNYVWQTKVVRAMTVIAPLCFLVGLSLSLVFLYWNLR